MTPGVFIRRDRLFLEKFTHNNSDIDSNILTCALHMAEEEHALSKPVSMQEAVMSCKSLQNWENILEGFTLLIGVPGNVMAAVTALSMERLPSAIYIFFLALGDLFTLLSRAGPPITHSNQSFEIYKRTVGIVPNMLLVLICLERYLAVCHPWTKKRCLTVRVTYASVALLFLVYISMLAGCLAVFNFTEVSEDEISLLMAVLVFGVPCPFIMAFNARTVKKLRKMTQIQRYSSVQYKFWSQVEASITYMMIITSIVFLVINGSWFIVCLIWLLSEHFYTGKPIMKHSTMDFTLNISFWLTFIHHALNFYLYVLGTKRFRLQWILLMRRCIPAKVFVLVSSITTPTQSQTVAHTTKSYTQTSGTTVTSPDLDNLTTE